MPAPSLASPSRSLPPRATGAVPGAHAEPPITFEDVWATIADAVVVLSPEWRVIFANREALELSGIAERQLLGGNFWELFPHVGGTDLERCCRRALEEGKRSDLEFHSPRNQRWYHVRLCPSRLGLTVIYDEICGRRAVETEQATLRERFLVAAATPWLTLYEQDRDLRYTWLYPPHPEHHHALGHTDEELSRDGSLAALAAKKREVMASGVPARIVAQVEMPDAVRSYDTYISPRRDANGVVVGVTGAALNVTDRIRAETALRESEARLRATYTNAPVGIAEADAQGRLFSINDRYASQLGYSPDEMFGRHFADFVYPEDREDSLRDYRALLDGSGGTATRERRYVHKQGHVVWIAVTRSIVRGVAGEPKFAMAVAVDITDRKLANLHQQLLYRLVASVNRAATASEVYEAALDALCQSQGCARGSILLYDSGGVMRFVAWRGLSDAYRAAVEGHSPWKTDDPDPQPVCIANIADAPLADELRAVVRQEGIEALAFIPLTFERRLLGKFMIYFDRPHEFTVERLQMAETIARQVSFAIERQRASDQLETLVRERTASLREAIQQMEEFSYTVSHDLRAPIRGMLTYTNVILEDHGGALSPEVVEYLRRIAKNAGRMDALVRDTLAYSRVARGQLEFTNVSLDDCAAQALAESAPSAEVRLQPRLGHVVASEPLLMQVFTNLFGNAVKFVRRDTPPRIEVSSERSADRIRVRIRDNGIGIPPHLQARVFAMFERLHAGSEYEGTGIGLAIVRKAIDRMGGQLGVDSDGVNGSTFWIELPAAQ